MKQQPPPYNEVDEYIATLTPEEQQEVAVAEAALDLAYLLYQAREKRALSQASAGSLAGLKQQMVSRLEHTVTHVQLQTLRRYLSALGYSIDIIIKDTQTGDVLGHTTIA